MAATMSSDMLKNLNGDEVKAATALKNARTGLTEIAKLDGDTKQEAAVKALEAIDAAVKKEIGNLKVATSEEVKHYKPVREKVTKLLQDALKAEKAVAPELAEAKKMAAFPKGKIHVDAIKELGSSSDMIKAVKMVFEKSAGGRSAPGTSGVNHIHVGGNAQENLLFDTGTATVLGVVQGHMDKTAQPTVLAAGVKVAGRKGGSTKTMRIVDGKLVEVK